MLTCIINTFQLFKYTKKAYSIVKIQIQEFQIIILGQIYFKKENSNIINCWSRHIHRWERNFTRTSLTLRENSTIGGIIIATKRKLVRKALNIATGNVNFNSIHTMLFPSFWRVWTGMFRSFVWNINFNTNSNPPESSNPVQWKYSKLILFLTTLSHRAT